MRAEEALVQKFLTGFLRCCVNDSGEGLVIHLGLSQQYEVPYCGRDEAREGIEQSEGSVPT